MGASVSPNRVAYVTISLEREQTEMRVGRAVAAAATAVLFTVAVIK